MQGTQLCTDHQHQGIRLAFADAIGLLERDNGGIAAQKIDAAAVGSWRQSQRLHQLNVQTRCRQSRASDGDEVGNAAFTRFKIG